MHVVVAVCTAQRPKMLKSCLEALLRQSYQDLEIVVVENDEAQLCRDLVEGINADAHIPVHYVCEAVRGIPVARNRAVSEALKYDPDWIALIDDDEEARSDWIEILLAAARAHDADVSHGKVERLYEDGAKTPNWWKQLKPMAVETGTVLNEAATNNILMSSRVVADDGLAMRFDEALTFGCEDIDFFSRLYQAGGKIVWVEEAVVVETIPASRVTPERLLARAEMSGAGFAFWTARRKGRGAAYKKFALKGVRRFLTGLVIMAAGGILSVIVGEKGKKIYYKGMLRYRRGRGNIRGLLQFHPDYYGKIDGQ